MKIHIGRWLVAFLLFTATPLVFAGLFKSKIITSSPLVITVPDGQFLRIWNFTQEGGVDRGMVSVTLDNGQTANVLAASLVDLSSSAEVINRVTIAGPAQATIAPVLGATLFITYRKGENESGGTPTTVVVVSPTPTPTPTPTATLTPTPTPTATPTPTP
jgi:hypothetical protein